jgi:L-threonylcarbamoyladenylate synthase
MLTLEEPRALEQAIAAIQQGGVVAFPTDTVYGIGTALTNEAGLDRIFEIKGRDRERALPILLASPGKLDHVSSGVSPSLLELATTFWPGPLTVAVPAREGLPYHVIANDGTVGVRVPNHSVALFLAQRNGGAIAATSANRSGQEPATRTSELDEALADSLDLILDGGMTPGSVASTVIRLDGATISIIREGAIAATDIQAAWSRIVSGDSDRIANEHQPATAPHP